jgi:hypothetical protein
MSMFRNIRRLLKKQGKIPSRNHNFFLETLEPRLLLSGDPQNPGLALTFDTLNEGGAIVAGLDASSELIVVSEVEGNDTLATATPLPLTEDPAESGLFLGKVIGSIQTTSDVDYWSFSALAGDIVSVSVDTPDPVSGLRPSVYLYNAAGSALAGDSQGARATTPS